MDNVREPFLVALSVAHLRGEGPLPIHALKKRVQRGRLSRRLIQATAIELEREGFIKCLGGRDECYKLSVQGEGWTAERFEVDQQGEQSILTPRLDSPDLPAASTKYRGEVRREAWRKIGITVLPLILTLTLIVVLR